MWARRMGSEDGRNQRIMIFADIHVDFIMSTSFLSVLWSRTVGQKQAISITIEDFSPFLNVQ